MLLRRARLVALCVLAVSRAQQDRCVVCERVVDRTVMLYEQVKAAQSAESPQETALESACAPLEGTRFEQYFAQAQVSLKECAAVVDVVEGELAALLETEGYNVDAFDGAASMLRAHALVCGAVCPPQPFVVASPAVANRTQLPDFALCDGAASPELEWIGSPAGTRSFAVSFRPLLLDQEMPTFDWLAWDLTATALRRGDDLLGKATVSVPFRGPCPVEKKTGYRLELLALSLDAPLLPDAADDEPPMPTDFFLATRNGAILGIAVLDVVVAPPTARGSNTGDDDRQPHLQKKADENELTRRTSEL